MTESRYIDPEDEAFNEIERQAKQRMEAVTASIERAEKRVAELKEDTDMYNSGWNSALEMAATMVGHNFKNAFGADTLSSMAIYIRSLKK
jgi:hypothetical protein